MNPQDPRIQAVRAFNRFYTRQIGILQEGLLGSDHSLTEVRVMYELAHRDGPSASDLVADLDLDPGYLSRLLKRLEKLGLLRREAATEDGRRRRLRLTPAGRRTYAKLDTLSSRQVADMLASLGDAGAERLVAAMATLRSLLGDTAARGPIVLRQQRPGDIGWVIQRHGELYHREQGWGEGFERIVADIAARFVNTYDPERERCWIAERDGHRLGCVFVVAQSRRVARLRMLLVEPEARGSGLGRRLVEECIGFAREAGYHRMVLWTQRELAPARRIYAATGFRVVASEAQREFGHDLVAETWELDLRGRHAGRPGKPVSAA